MTVTDQFKAEVKALSQQIAELKAQSRLFDVLSDALEGQSSHKVRAMTGFPEASCDNIIAVRDEADALLRAEK